MMRTPDQTPGEIDPLDAILRDVHAIDPREAALPEFPGFDLLDQVGSGAFGTVYRAWDQKLKREVALKVLPLDPTGRPRGRFFKEAQALARVRHPNVLAIHSVLEHGDVAALCTDYIRGETLRTILDREGPLDARQAARIGIELCQALGAVHASGILHRDVKTANVIREPGGRVILTDFGLGAFLDRGTCPETPAGSPLFMSPEAIAGQEVDLRSDLYSLGVLLYHVLTGRFPFAGDDAEALLEYLATGRPVPPGDHRPGLPEGIVRVVLRAIEVDPDLRFPSAGEMEAALVQALSQIEARGSSPRRLLRWTVLTVLLAGGIAAAIFFRERVAADFDIEASLLSERGADSLQLEADTALHLYLLAEDVKGRKYLLESGGRGGPQDSLKPGEVLRRPLEAGWEAEETEGRFLLALASLEPIGPLEDAAHEKKPVSRMGKEAWTRLKPVTVRGMLRRIAEITGRQAEAVNAEERDRLADQAVDIGPQRGRWRARGIWIGKAILRKP